MRKGWLLICFLTATACASTENFRVLGPQGVNLWKLDAYSKEKALRGGRFVAQDAQAPLFGTKEDKRYNFPAQWFEQPLDHFDKGISDRFHQRYWVNTRHYRPRPGAPVIVLDGGETSGEVGLSC